MIGDIDIRCAVRLSAVPMRRLPFRGDVWARDDRPRDVCGRRRSPATLPGHRKGAKPPNAGLSYPPSPLTTDEALRLLDQFGRHPAGVRDRALTVLLWRSGLRISEALALEPHDLDRHARTITVRKGKGGKYGVSGMDEWGWQEIEPWLALRDSYPAGPVFCVVEGATRGGRMGAPAYRVKLKELAREAGISRRVAPHQLRHTHAVDLAREHQPVLVVSRQLRHSNLAITTNYLVGMTNHEAIEAIAARPAPSVTKQQTHINEEEK